MFNYIDKFMYLELYIGNSQVSEHWTGDSGE